MSRRSPADTERWMEQGSKLFTGTLAGVDDEALAGPSGLAGWTGRHLVAHVAANADALANLVQWARTGEETPMYASPAQRTADIEAGAQRTPAELRDWVATSAERLAEDFAGLSAERRRREVRTAQGRLIPATEIAWLRAREVMVHSVDLCAGVAFAELPSDFLVALVDDIVIKRSSGDGPALLLASSDTDGVWAVPGMDEPVRVSAPLAEIAAYLAGRPGTLDDAGVPDLPRWL